MYGQAACSFGLSPDAESRTVAEAAGFRLGAKGTHTSRTIMLAELEAVLAAAGARAARAGYAAAIVEANCLSKPTAATRRLSCQRLRELYGLDPRLPPRTAHSRRRSGDGPQDSRPNPFSSMTWDSATTASGSKADALRRPFS